MARTKRRRTATPATKSSSANTPPRASSVPSTCLRFEPGRFVSQGFAADSSTFHYVVRPLTSGGWELRVYQYENDTGVRTHETFASNSASRLTKEACIAIAQAFHNLGDSYNEFGHGYRSRFNQAIADAEGGPALPVAQRPASSATARTTSAARSNISQPSNSSGTPTRAVRAGAAPHAALPSKPRQPMHSVLDRQVYVELHLDRFHITPHCEARRWIEYQCTAKAAHRSRLRACTVCAGELSRHLGTLLGTLTSGERSRLAVPTLHAFRSSEYTGPRPERPRREPTTKKAKKRKKRANTGRAQPVNVNAGAKVKVDPDANANAEANAEADATDFTYGNPTSIDDTRFTHRSPLDWGTASFGQHPEEFLGNPTDDDHDWRGGSALYE